MAEPFKTFSRRAVLGLLPAFTFAIAHAGEQSPDKNKPQSSADPAAQGFILTDVGTGLERVVLIEALGLFRLGFSAADNWGLDQWFDLVNDPQAKTNLLDSKDPDKPQIAEPGLFQQVFYGTVPDDPKLFTLAAFYFFPDTPRDFKILETSTSRIVVESTSRPMVNAVGVLNNVTCRVKYAIHLDGRIDVTASNTCEHDQDIRNWFFATLGLADPTKTDASLAPDNEGWVRSTPTQSPYEYLKRTEPFIYAYWSDKTPEPYRDWARASILLVPDPKNPIKGKQSRHSWKGFKRWFYEAENVRMAAGQTITQNYMIQLGTKGSARLPNIDNAATATAIARAYLVAPN